VTSLTCTAAPDPACTTTYIYDLAGKVATTKAPPVSIEDGSGAAATISRPSATLEYNAYGEAIIVVEPRGNRTSSR
jgi:hypothetical protein